MIQTRPCTPSSSRIHLNNISSSSSPSLHSSPTTSHPSTPRTPQHNLSHTPNRSKLSPSQQYRAPPTLAMSLVLPAPHSPSARPSSRSERLLRDTLRRDARSRSRSRSHAPHDINNDDENEDEDEGDRFAHLQPSLLFRTARRNSAHAHGYVPDAAEAKSYSQLVRSTSLTARSRGASGSGSNTPSASASRQTIRRSHASLPTAIPRLSPPSRASTDRDATRRSKEKENEKDLFHAENCTSTHQQDAPHEAVLRSRLERVLSRGMKEMTRERERARRESVSTSAESSSPPSSLRSLSDSHASSGSTGLTAPDTHGESCTCACTCRALPTHPQSHDQRARSHRHTKSMSAAQPPPYPYPYQHATSTVASPLPKRSVTPVTTSPWMMTPLPPSPPLYPHSPNSPHSHHSQSSPRSPNLNSSSSPRSHPHSPHMPHTPSPRSKQQFDAHTASIACRQVSGYVSFASVAGLGAPAGMDDDSNGDDGESRGRGRKRGKWWVF
ncbi:hypothetical protein BJ138DRAFT_1121737 [Hygrophoropsis aurantiaca]|uniref:Uncharacterized protein n=1 Tax=Hygrophoropsis aurantiaca TaxID=72124 RepID=A0ACB8ATN9_9AGAM|nr:hypothetical protein BJ138DRAFT_1121737 [Hygrophoropsis aurantiaca]